MRIGRVSKFLSPPGYSCCHRCHTTWKFVIGHTTRYSADAGCFPLCEKCWEELEPKDRLPFYKMLWNEWNRWRHVAPVPDWEPIEAAVMSGK